MKKTLSIISFAVLLVACGSNPQNNKAETIEEAPTVETKDRIADASTVHVYYFHGKQRCKTCIAVGNVTENFLKELYAQNPNVKFTEVQTDDEANAELVEKYQVTWNALIITTGDNTTDITRQAFAHAVNSPEKLTELIRTEIDKRL